MTCCYELFLAWFCSYDVDTVLDSILIWFQLWFLMWVRIVIWSQHIQNRIKTISKSYQNRIKIVSKPYQNRGKTTGEKKTSKNRPKICPWVFSGSFIWSQLIGTISKSYQNNIKIVSNLYQNRIKTIAESYQNHQNPREIDQKAAPGCFCFVSWSQPVGNTEKGAPFPNHIKITSKTFQNHF